MRYLFDGNNLACVPVNGLVDDAKRPIADLLEQLILCRRIHLLRSLLLISACKDVVGGCQEGLPSAEYLLMLCLIRACGMHPYVMESPRA